ncbi:glycosyl transferase family 1 [Microbacterium faecale]|uniref:Glycosyl transferase family 1 n=1 Tax=Microbacterium faecale TaxID=1804630 RepID=A0A916Y5L0_9MICO|nr:glycosyltransferase family 1 protein [Microbacterium faecale]GGD31464.1 glycosyl transferase family 1 [Microbacterium faecale]
MDLWVDTRWEGRHGIGRYAREVSSRLTLQWRPLDLKGSPAASTGALSRVPNGIIYSPGYNAFLRAKRQVITIHDLIHLQAPWPGRAKYLAYYNAVLKPIVKRNGVVITVSETSRQAIATWLNDPSVDIVNAGLGASAAFSVEMSPIESSTPYLLYVGNLRAHKNICVALEAMSLLPNARMRMLVPASEHAEVLRRCSDLNIADRVELLPEMTDPELARQYRGAAATVMPSILEGFGLPALESVMSGTPVLFWQGCAAVAETVGARGTAVQGSHDADEWASVMNGALSDPQRVEPPSGSYDWATTATAVERVLSSVGP